MADYMFLLIVVMPLVLLGVYARTIWWLPGLLVFALAVYVGTASHHHEVHGDIPVISVSSESLKTVEMLGLFFLGAILLGVGAKATGNSGDQRTQPSPLPVATAMAGDDKPN